MTISVQSSQSIFLGDGITTTWTFPWVGVSASYVQVFYVDANGTQTLLSPTQYTLILNAASAGQLWGVGGTVTYPTVGSPIANDTSIIVQRVVPYSQTTAVTNQTAYPRSVQIALDTLCLEIQQVVCRTGQQRGVWSTGVQYNFGDIVQDGINGAYTNNFYMCAIPNLSTTWTADLAAGYWSLVFDVQQFNAIIGAYLPLTGGTVTGNVGITGTLTGNNGAFSGTLTTVTQSLLDNSTKAATTAFVQALISASSAPVATGTVVPYAGFTAAAVPAGYLLCNSGAYSRATYSALFNTICLSTTGNTNGTAVVTNIPSTTNMTAGMPICGTDIAAATTILTVDSPTQITLSQAATGTTVGAAIVIAPHGVGDGSTTFNMPDLRGAVPAGVDDMGGVALNRLTFAVSGISAIRLGAAGGDQRMQQHTHTANVTDPTHTHTVPLVAAGSGGGGGVNSPLPPSGTQGTTSANGTGISVTNANTGSGTAQNVQPTIMLNYIIKT